MLRWKPIAGSVIVAVECCDARPNARDAIMATTSSADQKRGQPPFRYRCKTCGPTQGDYPRPNSLPSAIGTD